MTKNTSIYTNLYCVLIKALWSCNQ